MVFPKGRWDCGNPFITPNFVMYLRTYNFGVPTLIVWCQTILYDAMIIFINENVRAKERG